MRTRWRRGRLRRRSSPRLSFLLRLFATCLGVLLLVGTGLYLVQAHDAREIVAEDAGRRHLAQGRLIETAYVSAEDGEQPWDEVREVVWHAQAATGADEVLVISSSGRVVVATDAEEEGEQHLGETGRRALETGELVFTSTTYDGHEFFELLSPIELGGERFVFEVEFEPEVLTQELAALKRSALQALAASLLLAVPLLYLLGGRTLASRYSAAADSARRDGLTGLLDSRSFQYALRQEVARALRYDEPLTLALVDVDDFKRVNDTGGHRYGDEVLVALAAVLDTARSTDRAFRVGGDEFALLLPHTELDVALDLLARLRQAAAGRLGGTTMSIGVAELVRDGDADLLRDHADTALYEAKHRGRDQVTSFAQVVEPVVGPGLPVAQP